MSESPVDLSVYSNKGFDRGRPCWVEAIWKLVSAVVFQSSFVPCYGLKRSILRSFGSRVGKNVIIKPRVTITFPWKVAIGDHSWVGEGAWLDSLENITIGSHVCISQGAYLCTGNHDYKSKTFELRAKPIEIKTGAWVAAGAIVGPGVTLQTGAVLALGSVATQNLEAMTIYRGNPAVEVGKR